MSTYAGSIVMFAGIEPPPGWAFCNGQVLRIDYRNRNLAQVLGDTFGGDGQNTVGLPDLRGRTVVHSLSESDFGQKAGATTKTITTDQIPAHTHKATALIRVNSNAASASTQTPKNNYPGNTGKPDKQYSKTPGDWPSNEMAFGAVSATVAAEGGNQGGISNMQPYLAVNFIIAVEGDLPPQPEN